MTDTPNTTRDIILCMLLVGILVACFAFIDSERGHLTEFCTAVQESGIWGHGLIFVLFLFVAMPFGYNYSLLLALIGFIYGWNAVIDAELGSLAGLSFSFWASQSLAHDCVQRYADRLTGRSKALVDTLRVMILQGRAGKVMQVALRLNPLITYGMLNGLLATSGLSFVVFLPTSFIGTQYDVFVKVGLGVLLRHAGGFHETPPNPVFIIAQITATVLLLIGGAIYGRHIMRQIEATGTSLSENRDDVRDIEMRNGLENVPSPGTTGKDSLSQLDINQV